MNKQTDKDGGKRTQGGQFKSFKNFAFFRIYDAGHMVPMD